MEVHPVHQTRPRRLITDSVNPRDAAAPGTSTGLADGRPNQGRNHDKEPVAEGDSTKRFTLGTHRLRPPDETWSHIQPALHRAGVTRVADVTALDRLGIPVYQAIRPGSRNLCVSQGKSVTAAAARVSAAMESLELWHAESLRHLPRETATLRSMGRRNPIPQASFPWRPDTRRLDDAPMPWVEAHCLTGGPSGWLPCSMLEIDFTLHRGFEPRMFHVTSNGLASGNSRQEALLHALCEVIERHALYLARQPDYDWQAIDPDSVEVEPCRALIARFIEAGMKLALYDITWETGVPVVVADVVADDLPNVWRGCGCHPSPEVAMSRALTEAAQARLTYIAGARDDLTRFIAVRHAGEAFDDFRPPTPRRCMEELPQLAGPSIGGDLDTVLQALDRNGHVPYAVDLTRPDLHLPVVMVHVPGFKEAAYG